MSLNQRIEAILLAALIASTQISSQHPQQDPNASRESLEPNATGLEASASGSGVAGLLLAKATHLKLNQSDEVDALLLALLAKVGPDMRPMRDFRDPQDVSVGAAKRAWLLMHQHAQLALSERMQFVRPIVGELLRQANVSARCSLAAANTMEAAQRLDSWAIQLLAAWGNFPPVGLFEGTFGDVGSYHGCLDVPENAPIGHAHYCSLSFRPILPSRPDYELIVRQEPPDLLHLFDGGRPGRDAFADLLAGAQYHHYVYYKLGACFPIGCDPIDVQRLARLLARRAILLSGPVKCHSKRPQDYTDGASSRLQISTRDLNDGLYIWKPHVTASQLVSLIVVGLVGAFIVAMTLVDLLMAALPQKFQSTVSKPSDWPKVERASPPEHPAAADSALKLEQSIQMDENNNALSDSIADRNPLRSSQVELAKSRPGAEAEAGAGAGRSDRQDDEPLLRSLAKDFSMVENVRQFLEVSESQRRNEIGCINGIRCITMSWIVMTHTMQYNDWSAFARTRQVEPLLESLVNQPLFNGSYLVDTFFLISGLLTSYSTFGRSSRRLAAADKPTGGQRMAANFSSLAYLAGRYLRLTPQIVFVSLLFILLPLMSDSGGPHWYSITGEYSENCAQNWWLNLFHVQAFYRSNEMCNFVGWWISVDMLYHLFALAIILLVLHFGHRMALLSCAILVLAHGFVQAKRHYQLKLPPNLLSTIPQTGAMWSQMTLEFFWTPYAHALPYFLGFYLGYLLARDHQRLAAWLSAKRALVGWTLALAALTLQSYSTYFWVVGRWRYTPLQATLFHLSSAATWSLCLAWIIVACHLGHGGPLNRLLSCRLFMVLGKASYVVYLSHFLVLFTFFGSQNLLLEPTRITMLYVILGNVCLAMLLGSLLSAVFESPWLKMQRRIMRHIR